MSFYPEKVNRRFVHPGHAGKIDAANAVGTNATLVCGAALRFTLQINGRVIERIGFQTNGCGFLVAAAETLSENLEGKTLTGLHGLDQIDLQIQNELGQFDEQRKHCLNLVIETFQDALNDFRSAQLEEFVGEKALICTCFGVSEETIEKIVARHSCSSVEEVSRLCNAGHGCGSCQPLIQEIIDSNSDML